ncbi:MAG: hypothetical protein ACE5HC_09385 [Candidatus Binatia bacterium]
MENLLIWGFIVAGGLFSLVVTLLIASERELKNKNRHLEKLESELAKTPITSPPADRKDSRVPELEQEITELKEQNAQLQTEIDNLKLTLETNREVSQQLDDEQAQLPEMGLEFQEVQIQEEDTQSVAHFPERSPIEQARSFVEAEKYKEALPLLEDLLATDYGNQEARLLHLLSSVRLYNVYGYEKQIESLKNLSNLSENERGLAREIFLIRADEAQSQGREGEMLEYRGLAKKIILGQPLLETPLEPETKEQPVQPEEGEHDLFQPQDRGTSSLLAQTVAMVSKTGFSYGIWLKNAWLQKKAYAIFFATIFLFAVLSLLAARLWHDPAQETTVAAEPTLTASVTGTTDKGEVDTSNKEKANVEEFTLEPATNKPESGIPGSVTDVAGPKAASDSIPQASSAKKQVATTRTPVPALIRKPRATSQVRTIEKSPKKKGETTKSLPSAQPSWGLYEVLQPTLVYRKPGEESQKVARISAGMKVNVVEVHGDWLEIRSKYGRPPGFIKKNSAVKTTSH